MIIHLNVREGACCVMQAHFPLAGAKFHKICQPGCLGVEDDKKELSTPKNQLIRLDTPKMLVGQFSIDVEILCLCNIMLLSFDGPNFFLPDKVNFKFKLDY